MKKGRGGGVGGGGAGQFGHHFIVFNLQINFSVLEPDAAKFILKPQSQDNKE